VAELKIQTSMNDNITSNIANNQSKSFRTLDPLSNALAASSSKVDSRS
jgi:hypothetical protein